MARTIRNGRAFPKSVKAAVLAELRTGAKNQKEIADAYNMAQCTVSVWGIAAGIAPAIAQPVQLATHRAGLMAATAHNTPTLRMESGRQVIDYQGKTYR